MDFMASEMAEAVLSPSSSQALVRSSMRITLSAGLTRKAARDAARNTTVLMLPGKGRSEMKCKMK
jgi:hypothetical protein